MIEVGKAQKLYEVAPVGGGRLTRQEQEYISSWLINDRNERTLIQRAQDFGAAGKTVKVTFEFDDGRSGGLVFRRL